MSLILNGTSGLFGNVTGGDISGNFTGGNSSATTVTSTGSTTARSLANRFADVVNVKDFGAVGDGNLNGSGTDNYDAFQDAINTGKTVFIPNGKYLINFPLKVSIYGQQIIGESKSTELIINHTAGSGVSIEVQQVKLSNLAIVASNFRQSSGTGYTLNSGQFGLQIYKDGGFTTQAFLNNIYVSRHPNHGIYMGGEGGGTIFLQCESYYNRGHGYAFDDRTINGGTSSRCGIVEIIACRALDNGGNAINISQSGSTCYRFNIQNFETIWNAWNTSIPSLDNCEMYLGGENHCIRQCAFGDQNGDTRTTMSNGDSRLAKTTLSKGIAIRSFASNIILENNRFISTSEGVRTGDNINFLKVFGSYFTQQQKVTPAPQLYGFKIGSYTGLRIEVTSSSDVTYMVDSDTAGGSVRIDDNEYYVYGEQGSSLTGISVGYGAFTTATVTSTVANIASTNVNLNATGNTDLIALYRGGSSNLLPPAFTFFIKNVSAFTITLKNGTSNGYIRTKTGADTPISSGQVFVVTTDDSGNPFQL
jgi:hypothetical protein